MYVFMYVCMLGYIVTRIEQLWVGFLLHLNKKRTITHKKL